MAQAGPRPATRGAVAYAILDGPWGPVHVAADDRAIVGIELLTPTERFVETLQTRLRRPVEAVGSAESGAGGRRLVERASAALRGYFAGRPEALAGLPVRLETGSAWDASVLGGVRRVGWGDTVSYGELARRIGRPGAARAVGGAVGRNRISILVPCHRVIAGDGSLGGYGGEWWGNRETWLEIKRGLLALEGVELRP